MVFIVIKIDAAFITNFLHSNKEKLNQSTVIYFATMNNKKAYWLCQIVGWLSMVAIDTINYVYFIYGQFSSLRFYTILSYAALGILITHSFRHIVRRNNFFHKKVISIWLIAFFSSIIISLLLSFASAIINVFQNSPAAQSRGSFGEWALFLFGATTVSLTHLTLPTKRKYISAGLAASLIKH